MSSKNPYAANDAAAEAPAESKPVAAINTRAIGAMLLWGIGAFLVSLLLGFDLWTDNGLPGGLLYVSFVGGPALAIVGAFSTPYSNTTKAALIFAGFCLLPVQVILIGISMIATSGFDGIH